MKNCKKSLFSHFFYPLIFQGVKIWVLVVKNSKNLKLPAKITQIFRSFNINKIKILLSMKLKFHVEWASSKNPFHDILFMKYLGQKSSNFVLKNTENVKLQI